MEKKTEKVAVEKKNQRVQKPSKRSPIPLSADKKIYLFGVIVIILLCGFLGYCLAKWQVIVLQHQTNQTTVQTLQQQHASLQTQFAQLQSQLSQQNTRIAGLVEQARQDKAKRIAWVDGWRGIEADYLVHLAKDALVFQKNRPYALALLTQAQQAVQAIGQPGATAAVKVIAQAITDLRKTKVLDVATTYQKLQNLSQHILSLPLIGGPEQATKQAQHEPKTDAVSEDWKAALMRNLETIASLVRIQHSDETVAPVITKATQDLYYQYALLTVSQIQWAVLHQAPDIYQDGLDSLSFWVKRYFITSDPKTKQVIQEISALRKLDWSATSAQPLDPVIQSIAALNATNQEAFHA